MSAGREGIASVWHAKQERDTVEALAKATAAKAKRTAKRTACISPPKKKAKTIEQLLPPSNQDEQDGGAESSAPLLRRSGQIDSDTCVDETLDAQDAAIRNELGASVVDERAEGAANKDELDASVVEAVSAVESATAGAGLADALGTSAPAASAVQSDC